MESIIIGIEREIEQKRQELGRLEQALNDLRGTSADRTPERDNSKEFSVSPDHFQGLKGRGAIISFFHLKKSDSATLEEIEHTLTRGGAKVGKYPKRSVKLAVVNNPRFFSMSGSIVRLVR